jgi:hypothetical protein
MGASRGFRGVGGGGPDGSSCATDGNEGADKASDSICGKYGRENGGGRDGHGVRPDEARTCRGVMLRRRAAGDAEKLRLNIR